MTTMADSKDAQVHDRDEMYHDLFFVTVPLYCLGSGRLKNADSVEGGAPDVGDAADQLAG